MNQFQIIPEEKAMLKLFSDKNMFSNEKTGFETDN